MKNKLLFQIAILGIIAILFNACKKDNSAISPDATKSGAVKLKTKSTPIDVIYISYPGKFHDPDDFYNSFDTLYAYHTNPNLTIGIFLESSYNGFATFYGSEFFILGPGQMSHSSYNFQTAELSGCDVRHNGLIGVFTDEYIVNVAYVQDVNGNDITDQVQIIPNIPLGMPGLPVHVTESCAPYNPGGGGLGGNCPGCATLGAKTTKKQ